MNRKIEKEIIRLVDDDEDQRRALRFLLEAAGYEVRDYPSGRDFLVNDEPSVPGLVIFIPGSHRTSVTQIKRFCIGLLFLASVQ